MREFETENNQEKFTCGEFEYQVIRSARKTMTLEVRRDGNVIVLPRSDLHSMASLPCTLLSVPDIPEPSLASGLQIF